jgi:putative spermidine/putrescine transport system permease protein/spermidine/putrescine transport system permease protein
MLGLTGPALLLVTVTMLVPILWLFSLSFLAEDGTFSLEHYRRMLEQPSYTRNFVVTFEISLLTTAIAIALGYPLAYMLAQLPRRAANLCLIAVLLPFWTSLLVRTYAWLVLLQRQGLINKWGIAQGWWSEPLALVHNFSGTLIGTVHIMLPFLILPVYGTMKSIDSSLMNAAANLGASPTARVLVRLLSALFARPVGRCAHRLHIEPRLLRDPCGSGRRQGHHGLQPHRQ